LTKRTSYTLEPDIPVGEELRDSKGRVIDEGYVVAGVEDARVTVRGRGRPSLSQAGESPLLRVRLSRELAAAVRRAAENAGTSRSEWVRHALSEASRKTG
jgi:hypothetical protein